MKRERTTWEKHSTWLMVTVPAGILIILLSALYLINRQPLRGYTFYGLTLGVVAVALSFATFIYSVRKRNRQESMRGTMVTWLWAHVYLGLLALLASTAHAGSALLSEGMTSGKWLMIVFTVLVASGVLWRLVYQVVPGRVAPHIRNYSQSDSLRYAQQRLVEIEKLSAGKSPEFQTQKETLLNEPNRRGGIARSTSSPNTNTPIRAISPPSSPPPHEQPDLIKLKELIASRSRALQRHHRQAQVSRFLQGWRYLHIPLVLLFIPLLIIHIIAVTDVPARAVEHVYSAQECAECHTTIYNEWTESMHAHAVTSPVTIAQTNQVIADTLAGQESPDPLLICNNCHAPVAARLTEQATLPFEPTSPLQPSAEVLNEGVNCITCHQNVAEPDSGFGGLSGFQDGFRFGRVFYGAIGDPVGNAFHISRQSDIADDSSQLCQNCHNVNYDLNNDGVISSDRDLVLQTTYTEYEEYRANGGTETCISCHMPLLDGDRIADGATIPSQQDYEAPPRPVRSHSFVGVDYPLDTVSESDPQREAREELLRSAVLFDIDPDTVFVDNNSLLFAVNITNNDLGHYLPTGFAFARQMWVEITVRDTNGNLLFSSGLLANNTDDLCDASTMDDPFNPMREFVVGCRESDPQLVNFQQQLLDDINGGQETWLQHLTSGAIARTRPIDGQEFIRIRPNETRTYFYRADLPLLLPDEVVVSGRVLFRNLPPYFLRILAANQPPDEQPQIAPLIPNLQIVEMATDELTLQIR